jgi:hypothetical protein
VRQGTAFAGLGVGSGYVQKVVTRASRTEAAGDRGDLAGSVISRTNRPKR